MDRVLNLDDMPLSRTLSRYCQ